MVLSFKTHPGRVIEKTDSLSHVMAIALDPDFAYKRGVVRCITSREGDVAIAGYIDRSELRIITGESLDKFSIGEPLPLAGVAEIINEIADESREFIGLEDPDIFIDPETGRTHLFCTMPFLSTQKPPAHSLIHVGHAEGDDLYSLTMTLPVLRGSKEHAAKEVSIAPKNNSGTRLNLFESSDWVDETWYSTVRIGAAESVGTPWHFGETVFHPKDHGIAWAGGHASPGPLLPRSFIDVGEGKLLGVLNGREANTKKRGQIHYGMFSVGLFIYDYEHGRIDWVSPEPLIRDPEAKTITFASQFVETGPGEGILYAHVDDSFVRAYTLYGEGIQPLLP